MSINNSKNIVLYWAVGLMLITACKNPSQKKTEIETVHVEYVDSTSYAYIVISGDFPIGKDEISNRICDSLFTMLDERLGNPDYAEKRTIDRYTGTSKEWDSIMAYFGHAILEEMSAYSKADEDDRRAYANENNESYLEDYFPRWEYQMEVHKVYQHPNFVVFSCNDYIYMGGAHGGSGGLGDIVFDLRDGSHFSKFFVPNAVHLMQPFLRQGLVEYFSADMEPITDNELNDYLLLEENEIPLPAETPSPTEEGLTLTYGQYEIACYAAGMPSFTIPYHDLLPYLTDEAKDLLDLNEQHE